MFDRPKSTILMRLLTSSSMF